MELQLDNLLVKSEFYDARYRLKSKKEVQLAKIHYRYVQDKDNSVKDQENIPQNHQVAKGKASFQEIRILTKHDTLSAIYLIPEPKDFFIEKIKKQEISIVLDKFKVKLIIDGDTEKIALLAKTFQTPFEVSKPATKKIDSKRELCPLRSDTLSSYSENISPMNILPEKKEISEFENIKEKMKFSDLEASSGFTPKLKRFYEINDEDNDNDDGNDDEGTIQDNMSPNLKEDAPNEVKSVFNFKIPASFPLPLPTLQNITQSNTLNNNNYNYNITNNNLQRKETFANFRPFKSTATSNNTMQPISSTTSTLSMGKEIVLPVPVTNIVRNLSQETNFQKTIPLTDDQDIILEKCLQGESLFLTGPGGCGKSFLLKKIIQELTNKFKRSTSLSSNNNGKLNEQEDSVFVLATTGLAAFAIGGMTIHQYLSIPSIDFDEIKAEELQSIIEKTKEKRMVIQRCNQTKVIIIDEVSMLDPRLFEFLNSILQKTRKSSQLFGGVQLIVSGDFFQLPPVRINKQLTISPSSSSKADQQKYCFQSSLWNELFGKHSYELKIIHRQSNDLEYLDLLTHLRFGQLSATELKKLNDRYQKPLPILNDILPTQIYTHKKDVETINQNNLKNLKTKLMEFNATDSGEESSLKYLSNNCPAKSKIFLKIGAQVMLVKTIDTTQGLVNGARGIITKFMKETNSPVVRFSNGEEHIIMPTTFTVMNGSKVVARRVQIPLELSWAISVHKAQGITVDQAELHLQNAFEFGQVYVALSRVKRLDGISLKSMIPASKIACDQLVLDFYQRQFHSEQEKKNSELEGTISI